MDAVVFDVGGVLIEWDPRHLYRKLFDDEAAMERFLAEVCTPAWNHEQDLGRPFAEAVASLSARFPEHAELIAAYDERWEEMVPGPVPDGPEVLADVQAAGLPCYGLTNFSVEKLALVRRRFAFLTGLDGVVVSGEEGVCKPDSEIYLRLARRFDLTPARTLYVDDRADNVAAAEALGFRGHHFTSADGLRAELVRIGVLA